MRSNTTLSDWSTLSPSSCTMVSLSDTSTSTSTSTQTLEVSTTSLTKNLLTSLLTTATHTALLLTTAVAAGATTRFNPGSWQTPPATSVPSNLSSTTTGKSLPGTPVNFFPVPLDAFLGLPDPFFGPLFPLFCPCSSISPLAKRSSNVVGFSQ